MNALDTIREAIKISTEKFQGDAKYHHQNIVNAIGCFGEAYNWSRDVTAYEKFIALCSEELKTATKPSGYRSNTGSDAENVANYVNWFAADKINTLRG